MSTYKAKRSFYSLCVAVVIGGVAFHFISISNKSFDPKWAALEKNTVGWNSWYKHNLLSTSSSIDTLFPSYNSMKADSQKIALWLGASQIQSINQYISGDEIAIFYAHKLSQESTKRIGYIQAAFPNANYTEMLLTYLKFRHHKKLPHYLIIGITYDDLREPGIRNYILKDFPSLGNTSLPFDHSGFTNIKEIQTTQNMISSIPGHATTDTPQEKLEKLLTTRLSRFWAAYKYRNKLAALYSVKLRMYAGLTFGWLMSPFLGERNPVPEVPENIKAWNEEAFNALLKLAKHDNVKTLLYRAPHPTYDGKFYHNKEKYENYFTQLQSKYVDSTYVFYADLEQLIPIKYWGMNNTGRIDIFHFQAKGHKILGQSINNYLQKLE